MNAPGSLPAFSSESSLPALSNSQSSSPLLTDDSFLTSESSPDLHADLGLRHLQRSNRSQRKTIPVNFFNLNVGEGIPVIETPEPSLESSKRKLSSPRRFKHLELNKDNKNNRSLSGEEKLESPRLSPRIISTPPTHSVEPSRGRKKKTDNTLLCECPSRSPSPGLSPRREAESRSPRKRNTLGSEIIPSSAQHKRAQYCSQRSVVEIKSKNYKDCNSLSAFRNIDLKKIRESFIKPGVDYETKNIKIKKFDELPLGKYPKKNKKIDDTFLKKIRELEEKRELENSSSPISQSSDHKLREIAGLQEIVYKILKNEINGVIQNQAVPNAERIKSGKNDLVTIVQNTFLFSANFFKRLNQYHELVLDHAIQKKYTTSFLNSLHYSLDKLTSVKQIEDRDSLLDWEIPMSNFLNRLEFMKKTTHISEEVKKIINSAIGPFKDSIVAFLKELNPQENLFVETSEPSSFIEKGIDEITKKYIQLRKATCYEHIWEEPVNHEYEKEVLRPFRLIPIRDVINYFFREEAIEIPIFINGKRLFDPKGQEELKTDRSKYFLNFFLKLHGALGHTSRKEKSKGSSLEKEVEKLLKYIDSELPSHDDGTALTVEEIRLKEEGMFSPEIRQCFDLLKLGGIESWARADYYVNQRYGLFDKVVETKAFLNKKQSYSLEIRKAKNICLNFQVEKTPEDCFVEQKKTMVFNVQYQRENIKAEMLVSWKVYFPTPTTYKCILRPLEIYINSQGGHQIIEEIENCLINFGEDAVIQKKLAAGGIKIHHIFNNSLIKDTKGVTLFTP